jgi:hypothetical protein
VPDMMRALYTCEKASIRAATDPALLAHRQFVYETHLVLPMDF